MIIKKMIALGMSLAVLSLPVLGSSANASNISGSRVQKPEENTSDEGHGGIKSSGTCGKYVSWTWYNDDTVEVSGSGEMDDFVKSNSPYEEDSTGAPPWHGRKTPHANPGPIGGVHYTYDYPKINNVIFSDRITRIASYIFSFCENITTELILPSKTRTIGKGAFCNCSRITGDLIIPNNVTTIEDSAFYGCFGFDGQLMLPQSLTEIGNNAFGECSGFTGTLILPDDIKTISINAFSECSGFSELHIPNEVVTIEANAFNGCSGFTGTLTIPASVTTIGDTAFAACTGISDVVFEGDAPETVGVNIFGNQWGDLIIYCDAAHAGSFKSNENYDAYTETWYGYPLEVLDELPEQDEGDENDTTPTILLTSATVDVGSTIVLNASISGKTQDGEIVWTSGDTDIATVDNGVVTAVAEGTTIITAMLKDREGTVSFEVTVNPAPDPILKGDLDGDGKVTAIDRMILSRYLAGWSDYYLIK